MSLRLPAQRFDSQIDAPLMDHDLEIDVDTRGEHDDMVPDAGDVRRSTVLLAPPEVDQHGRLSTSISERIPADAPASAKYVTLSEIARGGMGAILRVMDRYIHRQVAMKINLHKEDTASCARFLAEARITGQLEHPNIVPVYDMGNTAQGRDYFTMQLINGRSLAAIIAGIRTGDAEITAQFPLARLLQVVVAACNGMEYAHAKGVVHRDLKPANVMVGDYGEVLVMDWGLAKIGATRKARAHSTTSAQRRIRPAGVDVDEATELFRTAEADADQEIEERTRSGSTRLRSGALTVDGSITGTPWYMPPEQAAGRVELIDERSDVYALGAILYEVLCLHAPVGGTTVAAVLKNVIEQEVVDPRRRMPERKVPRALCAIAMRALAKKADDRYQRVAHLRRAIERFMEGHMVESNSPSYALRHLFRSHALIAIGQVLILLLVGVWLGLLLSSLVSG